MVFLSNDPRGDILRKRNHGEHLATMCNAFGAKKEGGGRFKPEDFIEDVWEKKRYKDPQYQRQMFEKSMSKAKAIFEAQQGKKNG